jgi:N-succinyldiaminopimelate aminotransferase
VTSSKRAPYLNSRLQGFGTTIFAEMSALAVTTGAINLGQGFPDTDGPYEVIQAAMAAISAGHNQYPPGRGIGVLREAISNHQLDFYGLAYDPDREVLVTAGATEAIAAAILSLCEVGDEVVTFEPFYDSYAATIAMAGAQHKVVPLRGPDWRFDPLELAEAVSDRTRLILVNSPHNPTGKVFDQAELGAIAELCIERDLIAVTDEVYEHLIFDQRRHIPLAGLPGMRERTVSISSGGKTFSATGWKIGWVCAPPALLEAVLTAKQFLTYVSGTPFQHAIAVGLGLSREFFDNLGVDLALKRDRLCDGLALAGLEVMRPSGTYFATVDIRSIGEHDGMAFCRSLPQRCGVAAIPTEVFYTRPRDARHLVRFAFCKRIEVIDEAVTRLKELSR